MSQQIKLKPEFTGRQYALFLMGFSSGLLGGIALAPDNVVYTIANMHQIPLAAWLMGIGAGVGSALGMNQKQVDIVGRKP